MFYRRPVGLDSLLSEAGRSLARLNAMEGFSRAMLIGVVPLLALQALGSKQAVTYAYLLGSIITLCITLNFATFEKVLQRRWVLSMGGGFLILAAGFFYFGHGMEFALGIGLRSAAASLFSVCLSLYIMDYIGKQELTRSESKRMVYNGAAWLIGPSLGIWLWNHSVSWTPFVMAAASAALMVAYFWRLRLGPNKIVSRAKNPSINPFKIIPRYFTQPAMRLAYLVPFSRAVFWFTLFVYGPIYTVEAGLPDWIAGALLSAACCLLFGSPLVRKASDRFGARRMIMVGQSVAGGSMFMLFLLGDAKPIGLLFWLTASTGGVILDVLGNIPFMRMVKPRERTEMTMIFSTWREGSELLTPLTAALILMVLPFQYFYLCLSLLLAFVAYTSSYMPKRL